MHRSLPPDIQPFMILAMLAALLVSALLWLFTHKLLHRPGPIWKAWLWLGDTFVLTGLATLFFVPHGPPYTLYSYGPVCLMAGCMPLVTHWLLAGAGHARHR